MHLGYVNNCVLSLRVPITGSGGGGGGGCNLGVILVRVCEPVTCISKPTPFIYLAFEKTDTFIYLIIQNVDLFIYCPLTFCSHFLLVITLLGLAKLMGCLMPPRQSSRVKVPQIWRHFLYMLNRKSVDSNIRCS